MTNAEMKKQIEATARAARKAGGKVELFAGLFLARSFEGADEIFVLPVKNSDSYHFSYTEAENLKTEALDAAEKFDVAPEDYLLHVSQGW